MERTPQSGYAALENSQSITAKPNSTYNHPNISKILAELGMSTDDLNDPESLQRLHKAMEIETLESLLLNERERRQYYKNLPWLNSEGEQLEFLRQNGYYARQAWLRKNAVGKRSVQIDKPSEDLIAAKDISVGMPNELVRRSWGSPDTIDVAGNPIFGNERWRYKRYSPSPEGYRLQSRIVYFESGKVVGWEQIDH
jgi:hypothetical protein